MSPWACVYVCTSVCVCGDVSQCLVEFHYPSTGMGKSSQQWFIGSSMKVTQN